MNPATASTRGGKVIAVNSDFTNYLNIFRRSALETENRCVQRRGRTHGIEIFPQERDLATCSTQEHHIILAIDTPRRLDETFPLDFGDSSFGIGKGMYREVEETEILHSPHKPGCVTDCLLPTR